MSLLGSRGAIPSATGSRALSWVERALAAIAVMTLGTWLLARIDSAAFQSKEGRRLDVLTRALIPRSHRPAVAVNTRKSIALDGLIGRIEIPRLDLAAIVAEGVDARTLRRSVGHLPETALPGEPGNVVLAGHRDSFFSRLKDIKKGDRVLLKTPDGVFRYEVESQEIVSPARTEVLKASAAPRLTLITCYPFWYIGSAPKRFIVRASAAPDSSKIGDKVDSP